MEAQARTCPKRAVPNLNFHAKADFRGHRLALGDIFKGDQCPQSRDSSLLFTLSLETSLGHHCLARRTPPNAVSYPGAFPDTLHRTAAPYPLRLFFPALPAYLFSVSVPPLNDSDHSLSFFLGSVCLPLMATIWYHKHTGSLLFPGPGPQWAPHKMNK
jgi:hypothetical protein